MHYSFELSAARVVTEANYNTFVNPAFHPDRVMQCHDLLYLLDGEWEIALENQEEREVFQISKGDVMILPAGLHHYGTRLCSPNLRCMYIHVVRDPGDHQGKNSDNNCLASDEVLLPSVLHCGSHIKIRNYFSEIIEVYLRNAAYKTEMLSCLLKLLLCEMGEHQVKSFINSKCFAFVNEVSLLLQANPEVFYSVSDMALRLNVSEKTLNTRFKLVYHQTFYAWQMEQKLEAVCQSLHNHPDITLKEIAVNFGFCDEFHLSRAFKKKYGVSPKYMR